MRTMWLNIGKYIAVSVVLCVLPMLSGCVSDGVYSQDKIDGPFKDYDAAFRDAIMHRWDTLLDKGRRNHVGKVVLRFHLNYDGSITGMKVLEDDVGGEQAAICQKAVLLSAPFPHWPPDMLEMIGANYREITYTFNYYK